MSDVLIRLHRKKRRSSSVDINHNDSSEPESPRPAPKPIPISDTRLTLESIDEEHEDVFLEFDTDLDNNALTMPDEYLDSRDIKNSPMLVSLGLVVWSEAL